MSAGLVVTQILVFFPGAQIFLLLALAFKELCRCKSVRLLQHLCALVWLLVLDVYQYNCTFFLLITGRTFIEVYRQKVGPDTTYFLF